MLNKSEIGRTAAEVKQHAIQKVGEIDAFDIIPIKSSCGFKKTKSLLNNPAYTDFMSLLNVKTKVIDSNKKELVGTLRPIFNEKQLGRINSLIKQESSESTQLNALVQPDRISEQDVFWDNFWLFKKKEEEKRIKKDQGEDSDEEHKVPMKLGDYMRNPQVLLLRAFKKNLKKLQSNLIFINSIGGLSLMTLLFLVQLRYSSKFRKYARNLVHLCLFLFTILGFGGSVALLYKGIKNKIVKPKRIEKNNEYDIKHEELPEFNSETLFKKKLY